MKTEVGYRFAPTGKPYPDNWIITDTVYEVEGGTLQSRSGADVAGDPSPASGDGTLPYNSLSFCKTWLGSQVNITRVPQVASMRELRAAWSWFMLCSVRYPIRDEDCFWDYAKARCAFSEYFEYRYVFGDVHLGQSCRLKLSKIGDILVKYL
ncbi:hypothetical protein L7F22_004685 [Adiantum nelumboides]|nr:hypothetical protein [Adiantum nelumboides]